MKHSISVCISILSFIFINGITIKAYSQEKIHFNNAKEKTTDILNGTLPPDQPNIFISDIETIDAILKSSKKKYKIIYFFSINCHSSILIFPEMLSFVRAHDEFELYPVIGYRDVDTSAYFTYLRYYKFYDPVYILDTHKYGNKRNPFSRLRKLANATCPECDYKKMGFSAFYVLDENLKTVLHTNYTYEGLKKMEHLNEWYNSANK